MSDFTLDTREFFKALDQVVETFGKDAPKYLNKKAQSIIVGSKGHPGAVQLTPQASVEKIKAVPLRAVTARVIQRAKANGRWPLSGEEIAKLVKQEYGRMKASIAYTRGAGWLKAASQLGANGVRSGKRGRPQKGFEKSKAARGYARKATKGNLMAILANAAPAADKIGRKALQRAVDGQAADMRAYAAQELLRKNFADHSAK